MSEPHDTSPAPQPERPTLSPSVIVFLRLLLLGVAAGAVFVGIAISFHGRDQGDGTPGARYACPMHPEVRTTAPGSCPICQMALEPVGRSGDGQGKGHGGMAAAMPDMTAVENVRKHRIIDFVRARSLLPNLREMRGPAWVEDDREISAIFYKDQIDALAPDERGSFTPTASPTTSVTVTRVGAAIPWDRSTSLIHFRVDETTATPPAATTRGKGRATARAAAAAAVELPTSGGPLAPGQVGWLQLASRSRAVLGVPAAAIVQSPEGPYVLAWAGGQTFEKRPIEIGETFSRQGFAVVLSGLRPSDRVVSRATFFLDAERRLDSGLATGGITP